jgi:hypothetical protein
VSAWRTTGLFEQDAIAEARAQIREQVQQDVERALREARQAQADARAAGQPVGGQIVVPPPPVPPIPPDPIIITRNGQGGVTVTSSTGQPMNFGDIPPRVEEVALGFFFTVAVIFIGTPLARAFARRMDRKVVAPPAATPEVVTRLDRIEQAVEAIAIEVERISEGQRYVTKVMTESRALPSPNDAAAHELRMAERGAAERAAAERGR